MLTLVPEGEKDFGSKRRVWSLVYKNEDAYAACYVEWSLKKSSPSEIWFYLIFGEWGNETLPSDRFVVRALYRKSPEGFMVIDADSCADDFKSLATVTLSRDEVLVDEELKTSVFELLDAVWLQETRISKS